MLRLKPGTRHSVTLTVNGKPCTGTAEPRMLLTDFLRHELKLQGTHVGCEHGVCGACTVIIDGRAVRSCMQMAVECDGADVRTVEGLATASSAPGRLEPVATDGRGFTVLVDYAHSPDGLENALAAFKKHHALQCGFCTAGILMSATQYLAENPDPTEDAVKEMLSGHICRCTGYYPIVAAILDAAGQILAANHIITKEKP